MSHTSKKITNKEILNLVPQIFQVQVTNWHVDPSRKSENNPRLMREIVVTCLPHYIPSDEVIDFLLGKMKDRTWKTRGRQWRDERNGPLQT
jgi:hypothetical protein